MTLRTATAFFLLAFALRAQDPQISGFQTGSSCPKYTIQSTNTGFRVASTTATINLVAVPAQTVVTPGVTQKHSVAFDDGAGPITAVTVSVGSAAGSATSYAAAQTISGAPSNTNFLNTALYKFITWASDTITAVFTATGSNFGTPQLTITAGTNANPAVLTTATHGFTSNNTVTISGATGSWAAINGTFAVTVVTGTTFSIPVNSTAFGALTGSPIVNAGTFLTGGSVDIYVCQRILQ